MKKIKELPTIERPTEKLNRYGASRLEDFELWAVLLRSGSRGKNIISVGKEIQKFLNSDSGELKLESLKKVKGIGVVKASQIIACLEVGRRIFGNKKNRVYLSSSDAWNLLKDITSSKKEHFMIVYLDSRNQEIKKEIISIGTVNTSLVHPREVFEPAIRSFASSIIIAHNHPSNNLEPSADDIEITKKIISAGKILGINVFDHIILNSEGYFSMKKHYSNMF